MSDKQQIDIHIETVDLDTLQPAEYNPRAEWEPGGPDELKLRRSIREFGYLEPIVWNKRSGKIVGGHKRLQALRAEGVKRAPVVVVDMDETTEKLANIALNRITGHWDYERLEQLLRELQEQDIDILRTGFDDEQIKKIMSGKTAQRMDNNVKKTNTLVSDFGIVPITILDKRTSTWQKRRKQWLALGIQSELGRVGNVDDMVQGKMMLFRPGSQPPHILDLRDEMRLEYDREPTRLEVTREARRRGMYLLPSVSIFDPVLCEIMYKWFCPQSGSVLDPFAGGSVRGIVAAKLGLRYTGIDVRPEQIEANYQQADEILGPDDPRPNWVVGDSRKICELVPGEYDFILTSPPYPGRERYSDLEDDISTHKFDEFMAMYTDIIRASVSLLKPNRFIVWNIAETRAKYADSSMDNFLGLTVDIFNDCGCRLYNRAILVHSQGGAIARCRNNMRNRKLTPTHEDVFVFVKGDPKLACAEIGDIWGGSDEFADEAKIVALESMETSE